MTELSVLKQQTSKQTDLFVSWQSEVIVREDSSSRRAYFILSYFKIIFGDHKQELHTAPVLILYSN